MYEEIAKWARLAICANVHIKKALLGILHNNISDPNVKGLPSDQEDLYKFLQVKKNKIQKGGQIKSSQNSLLFPPLAQCVDSSKFDITIIRYLIQTFCQIKNTKGNFRQPDSNDKTLCAYVYRAAELRNEIFHYGDIKALDEVEFENFWKRMKETLSGLQYKVDIEPERTYKVKIDRLQGETLQELRGYLEDYKKESSNVPQEYYIKRRFCVDNNRNDIVTDIGNIIETSDRVNIFADAGVGKSVTAKNIKYEWHEEKILHNSYLIYFDSKRINQRIQYHTLAAPLFFSELGDYLRRKGKTESNFFYFDCVRTTIEDLVIVIDGIDEFPINDLVTDDYVNKLENKVMNNDKISAAETITAIYFGFLFPYAKVCLFGRKAEFERVKKINVDHHSSIFNKERIKKDLELLKFNDANIKDFVCQKTCYQEQQNGQRTCIGACQEMYENIKEIELCKIPTDLKSLIELYKKHPNQNIGKITRMKLLSATLLNRLNEHINQKNIFTIKTFHEISEKEEFRKYLESIRILGEISFHTLLEGNVTVQVTEKQGYFEYKKEFKVERKVLDELDFFYARDLDHYFILEPIHTLDIEFLSACFLFSHPEKWDSMLKLNKDRQLVIISLILALYSDDYFTKDFVENVFNSVDNSIEQFFSWLYDVEDVRESLPNGGKGYDCWYGLMEKTQKLSPSFFLLDHISQEVNIPEAFIPKTIVCFSDDNPSFEWHNMQYFKHNILTKLSYKFNIEQFLQKFEEYNFVIKGNTTILAKDSSFNRLTEIGTNSQVTFRIDKLNIDTPLSHFRFNFNLNSLHIGWHCDPHTIDMILNAILPRNRKSSSSTDIITIKCKRLYIPYLVQLNDEQIKHIFKIGLSGAVDFIGLRSKEFKEGIKILKKVEQRNKLINIQLIDVEFKHMLDLPRLGNRHVYLHNVRNVTDKDLIQFRAQISTGYSNNLSNYKIIASFVRKEVLSRESDQSMYLNLSKVDFKQVSSKVFVSTFSLIPSLSCYDDDYIPSSHWLSLSQTGDCRINEIRIWFPQSKHFRYFLNIKTYILQFVCKGKDELKELLNHIVINPNIQIDRKIKVFVVKYDENDWNYYEEIISFSRKTIEKYKNNHSSDDLLLDSIYEPFYEGEKHFKWWCCEISLPFKKKSLKS